MSNEPNNAVTRAKELIARGIAAFQAEHLYSITGEPTTDPRARNRYLVVLWLIGAVTISVTTWICFRINLASSTTSLAFLIVIAILSLSGSAISSLLFSFVAFTSLDYFFYEPRFTFEVRRSEDVFALFAFLATAFIINGLVRTARHLGGRHREQSRLLNELRYSEQRYRNLFENMPIGLFHLDPRGLPQMLDRLRADGVVDLVSYLELNPEFLTRALDAFVVTQVNEHAVKMLGAQSREQLHRPIRDVLQIRTDTLRRTLASRYSGAPIYQEETSLKTLDGRDIHVLFTAARLSSANMPALSLAAITDITERVLAQEKLQEIQAEFAHAARVSMLGELVASIGHELNQPLAAIAASGEASLRWLDRPQPDVAEVRSLAERINSDARRASDIIGRIRSMAAKKEPERVPISLDDVVKDTLDFLRHEIQTRDVDVAHRPDPDAQTILGDRTQLQQVMANLAVNAMQAMAQTGRHSRKLTITLHADDPTSQRCTFEDSGPGIPAEHLPRMFESFFTTKEGGMGMGLSICRSIIEAHGGHIEADNKSAHGGARLSFTLPVTGTPP